ncbi:Hypothetical protein NTJ_10357 [Nesidiocoris tenuis]|uniref:Uncharacterized protein n=1 Tax=Nesidiocoris tenuis TaxID=355587 RepID=A0ABN7AZG2_9HEMI|nr:Hypothetical protein NTJ_10357 [Nesidiocoris tenuis]
MRLPLLHGSQPRLRRLAFIWKDTFAILSKETLFFPKPHTVRRASALGGKQCDCGRPPDGERLIRYAVGSETKIARDKPRKCDFLIEFPRGILCVRECG